MWQDKWKQDFSTSSRQQGTAWNPYPRLGILCFVGVVMIVAMSSAKKATAVVTPFSYKRLTANWHQQEISWKEETLLYFRLAQSLSLAPESPDTLPPANVPTNQDGIVNVPPLNRPEVSIPTAPTPATPPTPLPPAIFPLDQIPPVSVPPLPATPAEMQTPLTTSEPLNRPSVSVSPAPSSAPVIEFGQPLPKITSVDRCQSLKKSCPRAQDAALSRSANASHSIKEPN